MPRDAQRPPDALECAVLAIIANHSERYMTENQIVQETGEFGNRTQVGPALIYLLEAGLLEQMSAGSDGRRVPGTFKLTWDGQQALADGLEDAVKRLAADAKTDTPDKSRLKALHESVKRIAPAVLDRIGASRDRGTLPVRPDRDEDEQPIARN